MTISLRNRLGHAIVKTLQIPPLSLFTPRSWLRPRSLLSLCRRRPLSGRMQLAVSAIVVVVWLGSSCFGFWFLLNHDTSVLRPDAAGQSLVGENPIVQDSADNFPAATLVSKTVFERSRESLHGLIPGLGELRVIVAIHPRCPCTRTTLNELRRLLTEATISVQCTVLIAIPEDQSSAWLASATVDAAKRLPNTQLIPDANSNRASQLGLDISGQILVIGDDAGVLFSGGITAGRSCTTDNIGSESLARLLNGNATLPLSTPTFGCRLK